MSIDINKLIDGISSMELFGSNDNQSTLGLSNPNIAAAYQDNGKMGTGFDWTQQAYGPEAMSDMSIGQVNGEGMLGGIFSDSGMLSKNNLSSMGDVVGMGTGLMSMYNSFQDRNMMEDMIAYGKDTTNRNLANSALLTNQRLDDRAAAKNAWNPQANKKYQHVDGSAIN